MPIKKDDDAGRRWVEMEVIVSGTPEDVWNAVATGNGNAAWFTPMDIEERAGGKMLIDFGAHGTSPAEVTVWEPPVRFGYVEREWSPGAPPVETEITVTGRPGNRCVLRMVHSLASTSDEWDEQVEGFESGWPAFFEVLRIYLARFAGIRAASFQVVHKITGASLDVWARLTELLGIAGANVGERRVLPEQPEGFAGIVEHVRQAGMQRYVVLRIEEPGPGVAMIGTYGVGNDVTVSVCVFRYGEDVGELAGVSERRWAEWVKEKF